MKRKRNGKKLAIYVLLFFIINAFTSYVWMSPHSINPTSVRKDNSNKNIYWMIDCLRGEEEQAYFSSDVAIVLEQYIRKLEQDDVYQYCIFGKQKIWHFSDATLKHYLFERFCMEERIEVLFKK